MNPMPTTIGTLDPPLGNSRLQIAKLISSILATNGDTINKELASQGTIKVLWVCTTTNNRRMYCDVSHYYVKC
jgi:serine/threonine-protein phosphatase 6 regulatory subunit 3